MKMRREQQEGDFVRVRELDYSISLDHSEENGTRILNSFVSLFLSSLNCFIRGESTNAFLETRNAYLEVVYFSDYTKGNHSFFFKPVNNLTQVKVIPRTSTLQQ